MANAFSETEKVDRHTPFRNLEIPEELLENILLVPSITKVVDAPTVKVEVKLSSEQVKAKMVEDVQRYKMICEVLGVDENEHSPSLKEILTRKASVILSEMIATSYYSKIRGRGFEWSDLYQTVEQDWTLIDYNPDNGIHFEIVTKREINVRIKKDSEAQ